MGPTLSRFPYRFPDERIDPKIKLIPAAEMPFRNLKKISEARMRPQKQSACPK